MPPLLTFSVGPATCDILVADITTLSVDAIVNAANRSLLGGGGSMARSTVRRGLI